MSAVIMRERQKKLPNSDSVAEGVIEGIGVAPGIAMGTAYYYGDTSYQAEPEHLDQADIEAELERFEHAISRSERELKKIERVARRKVGEDSAGIFQAQLLVLRDSALYEEVRTAITEELSSANWAVQKVLGSYRKHLEGRGEASAREKASDLLDVQERVLRNLQQEKAFSRIEPERIVIARRLTAADVLLFSRQDILGIVMDFGGPTSHVAIMARALDVPAVVSLHGAADRIPPDSTVIVDGYLGKVIVQPTEETLALYETRLQKSSLLAAGREELASLPAETTDGERIDLQGNIDFPEELPLLHDHGLNGIGLFRTEVLFLSQAKALTEAEQFDVYREAIRASEPYPVTIRLIDLGGDKVMPMGHREANPFLGWRGIRFLLDRPNLLRPQLRAVLRAATLGDVRILLPMVTSLSEVETIKVAIRQTAADLEAEGVAHNSRVPVGLMVEVPSVALLAERFASVCDFFSIGTNDLTQFTLAVDRGNDLVSDIFQELHPAVLWLVAKSIRAAEHEGIPVSICGEIAGDPRATSLFLGMGVNALSASPAVLPAVKRVVRSISRTEAQSLAERALHMDSAAAVAHLLESDLQDRLPDLSELLGLTPSSSPLQEPTS